MLFEVVLCFYFWYFLSSWYQVSTSVLLLFLLFQVNYECWDCTVSDIATHSCRKVARRKCQWSCVPPHICKVFASPQARGPSSLESKILGSVQLVFYCGCLVRNFTEGKDFKCGRSSKRVVWCVYEVLRTLPEAFVDVRTGGMD